MALWVCGLPHIIVLTNDDESLSAYYIFFIESSISSVGKKDKYYYFRNKYLTVDIEFYTNTESHHIASTTSSNSQSSETECLGFSASKGAVIGSSEPSVNAEIQGGFSVSYTQAYDTVNLSIQNTRYKDYKHSRTFQYYFTNWEDGSMISPNIGEVTERMFSIYAVHNYSGTDNYTIDIKSTATIFKDATWPRENYTLPESISFKGINGVF